MEATKKSLAEVIAQSLKSIENCSESGNYEWRRIHARSLLMFCQEYLPSGGGFDSGTKLLAESTPENLVFHTWFQHMNDAGYYDASTEHRVTVESSFVFGLSIRVSGSNRNDIKDYIAETFDDCLRQLVDPFRHTESAREFIAMADAHAAEEEAK
jgi:hypothetical protein